MNAAEKLASTVFPFLVLCILTLFVSDARAQLNAKQARKAITRMTGFELNNGAVRVKTISETGAGAAEATALVKSVFRFEKDSLGHWRVVEVRTGPDDWESIEAITGVLGANQVSDECQAPDPPHRGAAAIDPSVKRTRCLLGSLLGIKVPSDTLRIQEVSPFPVPLASQPSATVLAWIQVDVRLVNQGKSGWQVSELRTGNRGWVRLEPLLTLINEAKRQTARTELESIAQALERFRKERGSYLVADKQSVVIDHLSPRYLPRVIRLDPWQQPYNYQGQRDGFTLSSSGPDRKETTADDIVVTGTAR